MICHFYFTKINWIKFLHSSPAVRVKQEHSRELVPPPSPVIPVILPKTSFRDNVHLLGIKNRKKDKNLLHPLICSLPFIVAFLTLSCFPHPLNFSGICNKKLYLKSLNIFYSILQFVSIAKHAKMYGGKNKLIN